MKTQTLPLDHTDIYCRWQHRHFTRHLTAFFQLAKGGIVTLVLISVCCGYAIGQSHSAFFDFKRLMITLFGILFLATGSSALNQYQERDLDKKMPRTSRRPLPSGLISAHAALAFSLSMILTGAALLTALELKLGLLGVLAAVLYNGFYTTWWKKSFPRAAIPGSVPGALPVLIGYASASGSLFSLPGIYLFFLVAVWQMPHFWTIAIRYHKDYAVGGIPTLPVKHGIPATIREITLWTGLYLALTFCAPIVLPLSAAYLVIAVMMAGKLLLELHRFARNPLGPAWLGFFLWITGSLVVYLASASVFLQDR